MLQRLHFEKGALSENLERPNKRASFREEAVRLDSGECVTTNSRKSWDGRVTESFDVKSMKPQ